MLAAQLVFEPLDLGVSIGRASVVLFYLCHTQPACLNSASITSSDEPPAPFPPAAPPWAPPCEPPDDACRPDAADVSAYPICCRSLVNWRNFAVSEELFFTRERVSEISCSARAFSFDGTRSPSSR